MLDPTPTTNTVNTKTKAAKATKNASAKAPKTLGQIAYDSSPNDGGKSNFGPWEEAPQVVRDVHERMARAVEREVKRWMRATAPKQIVVELDGNPRNNPQEEWFRFISDTLMHLKRDALRKVMAEHGIKPYRRSKRVEADRLAAVLLDTVKGVRVTLGL